MGNIVLLRGMAWHYLKELQLGFDLVRLDGHMAGVSPHSWVSGVSPKS